MKKQLNLLLVAVAILTTLAGFSEARSVGTLYGDALTIGTDRANPTASITSAGVATFVGITNTSAQTGTSMALTTTLDVNGQVTLGADNTVSTITSAGVATFAASVTAPDITASDDLDVTDDAHVTGLVTVGETLSVTGASYLGATLTKSTVTAAGAATFAASMGVPSTGKVFLGTRTITELMAATAVLGEIGICSNCSPVEVFISTGAGAPNTGGYANAAGAQLD